MDYLKKGDYAYIVEDSGKVKILRYYGYEKIVKLADTIDGMPVGAIGELLCAGKEMEKIIVPDSVEYIEKNAFSACDELVSVELPSGLKELGPGVFKASPKIKEVTIDNNERYKNVDGIIYDVINRALVFCPPMLDRKQIMVEPGTVTIADSAFYQNEIVENIMLPMSITTIEDGAFLFTNSLPILELPHNVQKIEGNAFLLMPGSPFEKKFKLYAFRNSYAYKYAVDKGIDVSELLGYTW